MFYPPLARSQYSIVVRSKPWGGLEKSLNQQRPLFPSVLTAPKENFVHAGLRNAWMSITCCWHDGMYGSQDMRIKACHASVRAILRGENHQKWVVAGGLGALEIAF